MTPPGGSIDDPRSTAHQYRDGGNLNARIAIHIRFSTNPYGWLRWVLDQFALPHDARLLELGCGTALLWKTNARRIAPGWKLTLSDFSAGMIDEARTNLAATGLRYSLIQCGAQALPFGDGRFDAVVANHMLYHVPDRASALAEIRRALRPGGILYASTISRSHMREADEIGRRFLGYSTMSEVADQFGLENGGDQLAAFFDDVQLRRYEDSLAVTEEQPLVAYLLSMRSAAGATPEQVAGLGAFVAGEIREYGAIRISKDSGLFIAHRPA